MYLFIYLSFFIYFSILCYAIYQFSDDAKSFHSFLLINPTTPMLPESSPHQNSHSFPASSAPLPPSHPRTSSLCTRTIHSLHFNTSSPPSVLNHTLETRTCASMNTPKSLVQQYFPSCCQCKTLETVLPFPPQS